MKVISDIRCGFDRLAVPLLCALGRTIDASRAFWVRPESSCLVFCFLFFQRTCFRVVKVNTSILSAIFFAMHELFFLDGLFLFF